MECPSALIFVWGCCWNGSYMSWKPWKKALSQLYIIEMNICPTRRIAEVGRVGRLHWFSYLGDFTPYLERYKV